MKINSSDIVKSPDDFSFAETIVDNVNNRHFLEDVPSKGISADTKNSYIYGVLSAIGNDIGKVIFESTTNYIDNVSNIDLCKIRNLQSMAQMLGTDYSIFTQANDIPLDVMNLIDILSIKREYLFNSKKISQALVDKLSAETYISVDENEFLLSTQTAQGYFDDAKFNSTLSSIYYDLLYSKLINQFYVNNEHDKVRIITYEPNFEHYLDYNHSILIRDSQYDEEILTLKTKYNIPYSFDEISIVDDIDAGTDSYDNYSKQEQEVLDIEIERRKDAFDPVYPETRYKYYREKEVQDYITFVENKYVNIISAYANSNIYKVDSDYIEVKTPVQVCLLSRQKDENYNDIISVDTAIISSVAGFLADYTNNICQVRSQLKSQAQKNHMKGTFTFLTYVINEYLRENIHPVIKKFDPETLDYSEYKNNISEINYVDPVNYFNIETKIDPTWFKTNPRYWEVGSVVSSFVSPDNTNIFRSLPTIGSQNFAFGQDEITNFYLNTLKNQFSKTSSDSGAVSAYSENHLYNFLYNIFDFGAEQTHMDAYGQIRSYAGQDLSAYKKSIYAKYTAENKISAYNIPLSAKLSADEFLRQSSFIASADNPVYYYSNEFHPSYQLHPYLSTFMEASNYEYAIENAVRLADESMFDLLSKNIDQYIDADGYLLSVWNNPLAVNADYITQYEYVDHKDSTLNVNEIIGYDGFAYPQALNGYITTSTFLRKKYIDNILSNLNGSWYKGLNTTSAEITRICDQLDHFGDDLYDIAKQKMFDIYKYATDINGNMYLLMKDYSDYLSSAGLPTTFENVANVPADVKHATPGYLFVRLKDHPIAFPAFDIESYQVYDPEQAIHVTKYNNNEHYAQVKEGGAFTGFEMFGTTAAHHNSPCIYDMFVSKDKLQAAFEVRDIDTPSITEVITVAMTEDYDYDTDVDRYVLTFTNRGITKLTSGQFGPYIKTFFNYDNGIGFATIKLNETDDHSLVINTHNPDFESWVDDIPDTVTPSQIAMDCNNSILYVAYPKARPESEVQNYIGKQTTFSDLRNYIDVLNDNIVCKKYELTNNGLVLTEDRAYNSYSDIGFIPLVSGDNNFLSTGVETYFADNKFVKFQVISPTDKFSTLSIDTESTFTVSCINNVETSLFITDGNIEAELTAPGEYHRFGPYNVKNLSDKSPKFIIAKT